MPEAKILGKGSKRRVAQVKWKTLGDRPRNRPVSVAGDPQPMAGCLVRNAAFGLRGSADAFTRIPASRTVNRCQHAIHYYLRRAGLRRNHFLKEHDVFRLLALIDDPLPIMDAAAELLDACDRLGMLVRDETRMMSSAPEAFSQLGRMIHRDRNHPSVIMWSPGNEEWSVQGDERGRRLVESMKRLAHRLDPSRPITVAMDSGYSGGKGVSRAVDVQGFNYQREDLDAFHRKFPALPSPGTETAGTYSTRGAYENDRHVQGELRLNYTCCADAKRTG